MQILKGTYKGFIENEATNAEFKMRQLEIAFSETKEQIGTALLPIMKQFADYLLITVVPNVQALAAGLTGQDSVSAGITDATNGAYKFGQQLKSTLVFIVSIKDELLILAGILATVFIANKVIAFVAAIQTLITAMVALRNAAAAAGVATAFATGGASVGTAAAALAAGAATYGLTQIAPSNNIPQPSTFTGTPFGQAGGNTTNIYVSSIDSEGAARSVAKVLNDSASRSVPQLYNNGIKGN